MDAQITKNTSGDLRAPGQLSRQNPEPAPDFQKLTRREKDVLEQLARGFRYKEIVANLGISNGTLNSYISNVYEKLQVHSRTEAVVKYLIRQPTI